MKYLLSLAILAITIPSQALTYVAVGEDCIPCRAVETAVIQSGRTDVILLDKDTQLDKIVAVFGTVPEATPAYVTVNASGVATSVGVASVAMFRPVAVVTGPIALEPIPVRRTVVRRSYVGYGSVPSQWTWPGDLASHLSRSHGVNTAGMSASQMAQLHDSLHNGGSRMRYSSTVSPRRGIFRTVFRGGCPNCGG